MSLTDVDHPTRWKKGQSGNPSGLPGKPVGARTAFSQGFLKDLAESWRDSVRGRKAMDWTAEHQPATYFAVCSRPIGPEVKVTIDQSLPGNLSPIDWADLRELLSAIQSALPDAADRSPGKYFDMPWTHLPEKNC
jgi:hypothetical protein